MRITGGIYRGRIITCPPGEIRPAMDRMRESLFSILGPLDDCSFLDLFSGSGLVGIEAASRKAQPVHLVEIDKGKRATIVRNISFVESEIHLFLMPVQRFLSLASQQYDIVYADPPFPLGGKTRLAETVEKKGIVTPGGLFIIHYPAEEKHQWPQSIGLLETVDERAYGRSLLRFMRRNQENKVDNQEQESIS